VFIFYTYDLESLKKELNEKEINNFKEEKNLIIFEKEISEKNLTDLFLLAYRLRNLVDFGILIRNFEELNELFEFLGIEKNIDVKSKLKDKNFVGKVIRKLKNEGFSINNDSLFTLKIADYGTIYLDLLKNNMGKRYYLKFFENKCLSPILWQNFIYFLDIKRNKKVVNLKCCLAIFPIELIFYYLDLPGGFKRRDFSILKIFNLEEKLNKIDESYLKKIDNFKEDIFCLSDSTLDVDLSRKVSRTILLESKINFSKIDLFWVDWKFKEKEIDYLVSYINENKEIDDFFYQAEYLAKNIGLISKQNKSIKELAKKYRLKVVKSKKVLDLNFLYLK